MEKMYQEQKKLLETEYKEWLIDSNALKEKPKDKNQSSQKSKYDPPLNSFKSLEID
jgi:hypothetical protein